MCIDKEIAGMCVNIIVIKGEKVVQIHDSKIKKKKINSIQVWLHNYTMSTHVFDCNHTWKKQYSLHTGKKNSISNNILTTFT